MKKIISVLGILLLSTSCLNLDGNLRVHKAFNVKKRGGFLNLKIKDATLNAGSYRAKLQIKSDKKIDLEIKDVEGKNISLPIKSDDSLRIPSDGKFAISSEKIGQPFSVVGAMNTEFHESPISYTTESCSWTVTERRCEKVCTKEPVKCDIECKDVEVTFQGRQDVSYHYATTTKDIIVDLVRENSTELVASFSGRNVDTDKIYDFKGVCR